MDVDAKVLNMPMNPKSTAVSADIIDAAERAGRKVAPCWPLKHFVAVNPYLGLVDQSFDDAALTVARSAGARMTMPRSFYREAIDSGRISDADLAQALAEADGAGGFVNDVAALKAAACNEHAFAPVPVPTVADILKRETGNRWDVFVTDRLSAWAAGYFDEGQVTWASPWQALTPYAAWRREALVDRTPEVMGLKGFCQVVADLPETADGLLVEATGRLGLGAPALDLYFHRLLMSIGGWASYARYRVWQSELHGKSDDTLKSLLAVRLAWDVALLDVHRGEPAVTRAWEEARTAFITQPQPDKALVIDCLLQSAFDRAWQRSLVSRFARAQVPSQETTRPARKAVQAAFCIDVRSEVFRRAFESVSSDVETIGFAGFFGLPIEYVPIGQSHGGAQCPVLLTPKFTVCEAVMGLNEEEETEVLGLRLMRRRASRAWKSFKLAAVSSFAFVETMGWVYAGKLLTDALGLTRAVPDPAADGIDPDIRKRLGPRLASREVAGRMTGFTAETKIDTGEAILKAMSMTDRYARLVMLTGHGSTTVNNPHATGLDCGACGGHTGEANARVAAAILNEPDVRAGLKERGIDIPQDTLFLGCLHDTTTDEVEIFDAETVPQSHVDDLARLRQWLDNAGKLSRLERSALLNLDGNHAVDPQIMARSRDWSQVRPEWGLAGCAAFVAASRSRTVDLDLAGRSFLHDYDWRQDDGFTVLELIMSAPMVVASWISLQYYGSTTDNHVFGSGNKVLHNVVGTLGVLEGNAGDLRVGLPFQSVHDGERFIHEPLRLAVCIEAPVEAMNTVIEKHESVRNLLDNRWLYLFALDEDGHIAKRYEKGLRWRDVTAD